MRAQCHPSICVLCHRARTPLRRKSGAEKEGKYSAHACLVFNGTRSALFSNSMFCRSQTPPRRMVSHAQFMATTACHPQCSPKAQQGERRGREWGWRLGTWVTAGRSTWGPAWCCLFRARSPQGPGCGTAAGSEHRLSAKVPFAVRFSQCSVATRSAFRPTSGRPPFVRVCSTHRMQRRTWYAMLHGAMVRVVMLACCTSRVCCTVCSACRATTCRRARVHDSAHCARARLWPSTPRSAVTGGL